MWIVCGWVLNPSTSFSMFQLMSSRVEIVINSIKSKEEILSISNFSNSTRIFLALSSFWIFSKSVYISS